jgi:hypothetical protein
MPYTLQPLAGKVFDQCLRSSVGQHPPNLAFQHGRVSQLSLDGDVEKLVVGNAAPQEERQS